MSEIGRVALFGKLNPLAYKAIESATVFCKLRGNPYVELAHWLHQILQLPDSDLHRLIRAFELDPAHLARDLTEALDRLPRGSTAISFQAPGEIDCCKDGRPFIEFGPDRATARTVIRRYTNGLNGDGMEATLKRIGDEWFVVDLQLRFVS